MLGFCKEHESMGIFSLSRARKTRVREYKNYSDSFLFIVCQALGNLETAPSTVIITVRTPGMYNLASVGFYKLELSG